MPDLQLFKSVAGNSVICLWDRSAISTFKVKSSKDVMANYPLQVREAVERFDEEEDNPILLVFTFKEKI